MSKMTRIHQVAVSIWVAGIFCHTHVSGQTSSPPVVAPVALDRPAVVLRGHRSGVTAVEFSHDGGWLASSSLDGTVRLWSTRTWKVARTLNHGSEIYAIAFSPDGRLLVSGGYDRRLVFWETKSGRLRRAVKVPDWPVGITFTPAGQLAAGCNDGRVRMLDPGTGVIRREIDTEHEMQSLAVSSDGRYLATGFPIKLWDLTSGRLLSKVIRGWGDHGLAFTPGGDRLVSAEGTGGALIWSVPIGEPLGALRIEAQKQMLGPSGYGSVSVNMPATAVAFSRNGTWLATGGSDSAIQLWQVTSEAIAKTPAQVLVGHVMSVTGVSFSPDGRRLVSGSLDRTVRIWEFR